MPATISLCTDDDNDFIKMQVANTHYPKSYAIFNEFRQKCQLCDVVLVMEGKKLSAHRVVLAAAIPYFRGMFTSGMLEATMKEIEIANMEYDTMELLLGYAYTGELRISTCNVQSLITGASFLQLHDVVQECAEFLITRLHCTNSLSIRDFCKTFGCTEQVIGMCNDFIEKHFLSISKDEEFKKLELAEVVEVLNFDGLYVDSEEDVFNSALEWLKVDEIRHLEAAKILSCVRLPLLTPAFLSVNVAANPIIRKDLECRDLIDEAKDYHLVPERRSFMTSFKLHPRICRNLPGLIIAVGGLMHPTDSKSSVEIYDGQLKKWTAMKEMETLRTRVGVAVYNRCVYAIGGFNGHDRLTLVEKFEYDTNTWTSIAPLQKKRSALSAAVVGKKVYVCGGYDGIESLSSVEVYDVDKKCWNDGPDMLKQRSASGIAVLNNFIYVCGGHDGMQIFNTMERFDVDREIWETFPPMLTKRCRFGAVTHKGKIYVAGGYDGSTFLRSVEVFDPETMQWTFLSSMNMRRSRVSLVSTLDGLYAIAGFDGEHNLCSMEIYDETTDSWTLGTPLATHEGGVGVGVIPIPPYML
ncbi:unnamed protein product [Caenorhabditis angaria]|uniref:BTB domain-containing protein n=1 Tax=Caenorhabditis angaria TaxID=860376 RepID=A0A9P1IHH4_9PELO|nr:unnamed protein product [Caenorhabditis angaria]